MSIETRWQKLLEQMEKESVRQMLITSPYDIFYLTGELINPDERFFAIYLDELGNRKLFVNEIFADQFKECDVDISVYDDSANPLLDLAVLTDKYDALGVDKTWPAAFLLELMKLNPKTEYFQGSWIIDRVKMIKDSDEINNIKQACEIADRVILSMKDIIAGGASERKAVEAVKRFFVEQGADKLSFEPVVAYGENCANPHHICSDDVPVKGDSIIMDIGCKVNEYCSDITRTYFYSDVSHQDKEIYNIVLEANMQAIDIIKPGVLLSQIDRTARDIIERAGYGKYFIHRTGHSIGIEDHEYPSVGPNDDIEARPGMVFSVEPGIYLPSHMGVRVEDLVLVTEKGCQVLNNAPKDYKNIIV